jgi:hypothetical protein
MKLRAIAAVCTLFALFAPAMAQETKKEEKPAPVEEKGLVTRIFEVKYQNVDRLAQLLFPFGVKLQPSNEFKAITASGRSELVTAVGEAIKRFDVPVKNVEVTLYILAGLSQASQPDAVPRDLEGVVKQLRSLFAYQGYRLQDTMLTRSREGQQAQANGTGASAGTTAPPPLYQVSFSSISVTPDGKGNVVRIDKLRFSARVPYSPSGSPGMQPNYSSFTYHDTGISTDVDVREGQKFVVGKTGMGGGDALILVVMAKVVD